MTGGTTFMISMTDPSKMESSNETSTSAESNVTIMNNIPLDNTEMPKIDCKSLSSETANIGGKNAQISVTECSMESSMGKILTKSKNYDIQLEGGKTVGISYRAMGSDSSVIASSYDSNLGKLEETVKTLRFTK
jgi:hypothetical protein